MQICSSIRGLVFLYCLFVFQVITVSGQEVELVKYQFASNGDLNPDTGSIGSPNISISSETGFSSWRGNPQSSLWAYGDSYIELSISTIGYENIKVEWDGYKLFSGTGQWRMRVDSGGGYGGFIFTQDCPLNTWGATSESLNAAFNNNGSVKIWIQAKVNKYVYLDNLKIKGTVIPTIKFARAFGESCFGANDGMIQFYETMPSIHYVSNFSIDNGVTWQSSAIFTNLLSGTYQLKIKSSGGRVSVPYSLDVEPASNLILNIDDVKPTTCDGISDGAIDITASGGRNGSLKTNGTTGFIDLQGSFLAKLNAFTMEGWVKLNEPTSSYTEKQSFFGQNDVIEFGFESNNFTCWAEKGGKVKYPIADYPDDKQWHHVAVVGTGSELRLFIDGNRVNIHTHGTLDASIGYGNDTNHTVRIGAGVWNGDSKDPFKGLFSEVRFWNVARTDAEIQDNKFSNIAGNEHGLIAMYKFDLAPDGNKIYGIGPEATIGLISEGATWTETDPVYAYSWVGSNGFSSNKEDIASLEQGDYTLTVSSANSCDYTGQPINVAAGSGTANINLALTVKNATCLNKDGNVKVIVSATDSVTAFKFEKAGAYTDSGNNFNLHKGTLEAWIYPNALGSEQTIYCLANGTAGTSRLYRMWLDTSDRLNFKTNGGQPIVSEEVVHAEQWNYIAVSWSTAGSTLLVNNEIKHYNGLTVNTNGNPSLFVGDNWYSQDKPFRGYMRELRVWSDVRTANDLLSFKSQSLQGNESDLLAYWELNEYNVNYIYDSKNNFRMSVYIAGNWAEPSDIYSYAWTRDGDATVISSAKDLLNVAKGNYHLKVSQFNACNTSRSVIVPGTPDDGLSVVGDEKCEGDDVNITIQNSESGVTYQCYIRGTKIGGLANGTGVDLSIIIPSSDMGVGENKIVIKATKGSCELEFLNFATVVIHLKPKPIGVFYD